MMIPLARHPLRLAIGLAALLCLSIPFPSPQWGDPGIGPVSSFAQDGWKAEYDEVCSKTDLAMTLPREELSTLIDRCDKLRPKIELEEESTRKVYLRRLQMCRDLYKYVLEAKESK
jgi:hypothetical protein